MSIVSLYLIKEPENPILYPLPPSMVKSLIPPTKSPQRELRASNFFGNYISDRCQQNPGQGAQFGEIRPALQIPEIPLPANIPVNRWSDR